MATLSPMLRKTKIIATLGPATDSLEILRELILAGTNVFRLNMSHAPAEWCRSVTARVREAALSAGRDVGVGPGYLLVQFMLERKCEALLEHAHSEAVVSV